jgi:murein L,D-transpeptidase YcbB/YkuD
MHFAHRLIFFSFALPLLLTGGCALLPEHSDEMEPLSESGAPPVMRSIDREEIVPQIEKLFAMPRFRASLRHDDTLLQRYAMHSFNPLWVQEESFPSRVTALLRYLMRSDEHGLDPRWYHVPELQALIDRILTDGRSDSDHSEALARIELLLSDGLLSYSSHLRYGIVDPRRVDANYHLPVRRPGLREFLEPLETRNILSFLRNIQPDAPRYRRLQSAYAGFRDIKRLYRWPHIPKLSVEKIVVGDASPTLPALMQRLMLTGELFGSSQSPLPGTVQVVDLALQAYTLDSLRLLRLGAFVYDSTLAKAVMRYQKRHGLLIDGVVGARTVARMNRGVDVYTDQIRVNLERFRWMKYPDKSRYIIVNIPEYWLYAFEGGKTEADMSVCVGQPHLPTPQITGEFTHCIVNPYWYVPWSIASKEIYYSAKKDSNYLRKGRYKVFQGGQQIDASTIKWDEHTAHSMPFRFQQDPGRGNALGAIKFMFRNDFSIYLHDTPQQWAFKRAVRAVSHGCVRIQQPMHFARFLLEGTPGWDVPRLQQVIWSRAQSKHVFLKQRTPLYIDYYTAWVDSAGVLQFRDDVYGKDAPIVRIFNSLTRRSGS